MKILGFNDLFSKIYQVAKIASFQNFTFFFILEHYEAQYLFLY